MSALVLACQPENRFVGTCDRSDIGCLQHCSGCERVRELIPNPQFPPSLDDCFGNWQAQSSSFAGNLVLHRNCLDCGGVTLQDEFGTITAVRAAATQAEKG